MKIFIDEAAEGSILEVIAQNADQPQNVRIYVAGMSCSGPVFGLALDEQKENDDMYNSGKVVFVVEKDLVEQFGGFTVEAFGEGFRVIPDIAPASGCSSCGGSCG